MCLVLGLYQGWTMSRKDVYPFRHSLLKRFLLHQPKNPILMWRASSSAVANVLDDVYLSPALKAATVLSVCLASEMLREGISL